MRLTQAEIKTLLVTFDDYGGLDAAARKGTFGDLNLLLIRLAKAAK